MARTYFLPKRGKIVNAGRPKIVSPEHLPTRVCRRIAGRLSKVNVPLQGSDVQRVKSYYWEAMRRFERLPNYQVIDIADKPHLMKGGLKRNEINLDTAFAAGVFRRTKVWKYESPIDLGCMVGNVGAIGLIQNGEKFSVIDYDYEFALASEILRRGLAAELPLFKGMTVLWGDYHKLNFAEYDYFFFNGSVPLLEIMPKFAEEAKPGSLFVAIEHDWLGRYKDKRVINVSNKYRIGGKVYIHA